MYIIMTIIEENPLLSSPLQRFSILQGWTIYSAQDVPFAPPDMDRKVEQLLTC